MTAKSFIRKLIPGFVLSIYHYNLAFLGALANGFPSRKLIVIGVTGTSGKSTTVDLITKILERSGEKVASISTIRFKMGSKEWKNNLKMTMPGRFTIQKFFKQAVKEKCKYVVLEVSSEGVKQSRHKFIHFDCAVFTNLSLEHIESHGSFEKYRSAKIKFFKAVKNKHVINTDDSNAEYFLKTKSKEIFKFGMQDAQNVKVDDDGSSFEVRSVKFQTNLLGKFNVYNALCAICVANSYGVSLEACKDALEKAKGIEGRMEIVVKNPFTVVVDYAHTPEQLESVYKALGGNLICVLGSCGGGRDKWKRPVLGELASKYCNEIIVTNEDPYDENPEKIIDQIEAGLLQIQNPNFKYHRILDRKEAIKTALKLAKPKDIVIITGKGSEPLMCLANGKKIAWSDKEIVKHEMGEFAEKF
jgi:UDP-N-acetylmuramoyl-L-alanyl-D-glutamate--2,6-diaminopimelate ligase